MQRRLHLTWSLRQNHKKISSRSWCVRCDPVGKLCVVPSLLTPHSDSTCSPEAELCLPKEVIWDLSWLLQLIAPMQSSIAKIAARENAEGEWVSLEACLILTTSSPPLTPMKLPSNPVWIALKRSNIASVAIRVDGVAGNQGS